MSISFLVLLSGLPVQILLQPLQKLYALIIGVNGKNIIYLVLIIFC